jgi:glycosyltransferase involved in cell wall biosynthesis
MVRRACSLWLYTSRQEAEDSWPFDDSPRVLLPNGIEPGEFDVDRAQVRADADGRWPELGGAPFVLFLGRLHPKKRLDLLLEAFLRGAPAGYKLVVAGPDEANLWPALAARFLGEGEAARRVLRLPAVSGRDKVTLFASADLFVMPSEHENFGIAALEALAAGTSVWLSPHVDLAAEVTAAGWGETLPLDPAAWATRFSGLPKDGAPCRDPRPQRSWVAERYSWSGIARALEGHYRTLTGARSAVVATPLQARVR